MNLMQWVAIGTSDGCVSKHEQGVNGADYAILHSSRCYIFQQIMRKISVTMSGARVRSLTIVEVKFYSFISLIFPVALYYAVWPSVLDDNSQVFRDFLWT